MRPVGVCTRRLQIQNVKLRCWNWIAWNGGVWMSERESGNGMKASAPHSHCVGVALGSLTMRRRRRWGRVRTNMSKQVLNQEAQN